MKKILKFINSHYFFVVAYTISLVSWVFNLPALIMIYACLMGALIIVTNANRLHLITLIFAAIIAPRADSHNTNVIIFVLVVVFIVPFLFYDFIKNKIKIKDDIFIALLFMLIAQILSLINTNATNFVAALTGVSFFALYALIYIYFLNNRSEEGQLIVEKNALVLSAVITLQMLIYIIRYDGTFIGKDINFGWAVSNGIAMLVLLLIPINVGAYIRNQNNIFSLGAIAFNILIIIFTLSKGAAFTFVLIAIPLVFIAYRFVTNKKQLNRHALYTLAGLAIVMIVLSFIDKVSIGLGQYINQIVILGWFSVDERMAIYREGLLMFSRNPIFGSGSYTKSPALIVTYYHNFFIQALATTGIVGLVAFAYYAYMLIRRTIQKNCYALMILIIIVSMFLHGFVDNAWYNPMVMIIMSMLAATLPTKDDFLYTKEIIDCVMAKTKREKLQKPS